MFYLMFLLQPTSVLKTLLSFYFVPYVIVNLIKNCQSPFSGNIPFKYYFCQPQTQHLFLTNLHFPLMLNKIEKCIKEKKR